jgi:hypothetical protein
MAGKFFCPQCGALYEMRAAARTHVAPSLECFVCRAEMAPRAPRPLARPYRLIQRPEVLSDC